MSSEKYTTFRKFESFFEIISGIVDFAGTSALKMAVYGCFMSFLQ